MAAITSIRKYGAVVTVFVGIAILAFVIGDFSRTPDYFSDKHVLGRVDGQKIDDIYRQQYDQNSDLWKFVYEKNSLDESDMYQVHEITWTSIVNEIILDKQLKKLGLEYTDEMKENAAAEMVASLQSQQPNQLLGQVVQVLAKQINSMENAMTIISQIEEYKDVPNAQSLYKAVKAVERFNLIAVKQRNYSALAQGTLYFSDSLAQKIATDNQSALIKLMSVSIQTPAFAELKPVVSETEMQDYFNAHKSKYLRKQNMRDIDVAIFPINPTPEDLQTIEDTVKSKYHRFLTASSIAEYNLRESFSPLDSIYVTEGDINADFDSLIFKRPVGSIIEPFIFQNQVWYFGKVYGSAMHPDSIQVAYLVLEYKNSTNSSSRTRKQAKAEVDSLKQLIDSRQASIFQLTPSYLGGRQVGDTTMWMPEKNIIRNLYHELINTPIGNTHIYDSKSQGVCVLYQILAKTPYKEKRLYTLYPFAIQPSDATIKSIKANASQLMSSSHDLETFTENANSQGIQVVKGVDITPMAASIANLTNCRNIISWAFGEDTKEKMVSDVYNMENKMYAVAVLRAIKEQGQPKFQEVKDLIEQELVNQKKPDMVAQQLKTELASNNDYAAIAQKVNGRYTDSITVTFLGETYQNASIENSVIGKIFTLPAATQNEIMPGKNNVYIVSVYNTNSVAVAPNAMREKSILRNMLVGRGRDESIIFEGIKEQIKILDRRFIFYQK